MNHPTDCETEALWDDGEFVVARARGADGLPARLVMSPIAERPAPASLAKLEHAFALRSELEAAWAARPVDLVKLRGRPALVVEDHGGEFLHKTNRGPWPTSDFLRLAIGVASALGGLHARGLVHKDVKPANLIVDHANGKAWLTGFGLTSRLPRDRQTSVPPEVIAGTLAYMSPEQTGRMNRSIDSRSDLYSLGVTFYEMLTGSLPFMASTPMEWVHCHTARQPPSPGERLDGIPPPVSAVIMKLLAKVQEERYQTAGGVEADLRKCLENLEARGQIDSFPLGGEDTSDRLLIPERLYGRSREVAILLTAFNRIVTGGRPELVLVSGYSGIGKSAIVNELHKPLVPPRGLFASGKFDQYKRDIPYATLAQAFQSLIRPLLSKSEGELGPWRDALREALDPNGALIVELVPELKHIIGEQPPVPELSPQAAQGRFHLVFRRFLGVFARPEHPLALFLDDLQWLDAATLDLLEDLLLGADLQHLLLIGAYRDNEVNATHPLMRKLAAIRQGGALLHDIVLAPLSREDLGQLVGDALHCEPERAAALAQLIHEKTSGNPFFAIQFISTLADEGLLTFDYGERRWSWDLDRITAQGYTDNVVDLMVGRLSRLPSETRQALQHLACLGNSVEFEMLRMAFADSEEETHEQLWEAVRAGLIFRAETSYRFLHDRVQEAAYSLIPPELRAQVHFRIGTLLAAHTPPEALEEGIFEIVNQLNRGLHLVTSAPERERIASLNLLAGRRAKVSTAYASALKYLGAGRSLLSEAAWQDHHELIFSIECLLAECELLTAEMDSAEKRLTMLAPRARTRHDTAVVTRLQLTLYTTLDRSDLAIEVFLAYLRPLGTDWSPRPTREVVMGEYDRIWSLVGDRPIEDLLNLPLVNDPDVLDMLDVFTEIVHAALFYDEHLSSLVVCRMVNLSLEHGNSDGSCFGYVWFAMFAGPRFNNYRDGFRFGQLGYDLVEKRGLTRYQARTYISFGTLLPWAKHVVQGRELVRRASDVAFRTGDLTFSAYSWHELVTNYLAAGDFLPEVQAEAEKGLAFCKKAGFGLVAENCGAQLGLVRTLRGLTTRFGCFDDAEYNEADAERRLAGNPILALAEFFYWIRKLQARFFAGDYTAAVASSQKAYELLWTAPSQVENGDFRFFSALAHAAAWNSASVDEKPRHRDALSGHYQQLTIWAEHCPANFEHRAALAGAEVARVEGRILDAEHLYERAIHSAHANGFVHNEAVAHELAAYFYRDRGLATIAEAYLRNARACYKQWGAQGKVDLIDASFRSGKVASTSSMAEVAIDTSVTQLDADTVIRATQTLSSEINLTSLIEKLMRLAVEHAGAERGLLVLLDGDEPYIEGEAKWGRGNVEIAIRHEPVESHELLQPALHYVLRTRERVLLDDTSSRPGQFEDAYVRKNGLRSLLCLPILKQTKVIGALYLENNLTPHAFTAGRVAVLEVLAAQAAISLENARLYAGLERENLERKQVESELFRSEYNLKQIVNTIPTMVWSARPDGSCDFFNERWLKYTGLTEEQALEWGWIVAFHPDDLEGVRSYWEACRTTGAPVDIELRMRRHDGVYRWFLLRGDPLRDESGNIIRWYGTNLEIEDRKEAAAIRASERRLNEIISTIPTNAWSTRPDGYCDFLSRRWLEYAGITAAEGQGWGWLNVLHPDDLPGLADYWQACLAAGTPVDVEARMRRHDGVYRWFLFRASPLRDESGHILRWYGTNLDIEDRKQTEAIRASERNLRLIVNSIPGFVGTLSPTGEAEECNHQLLEYFGKTIAELNDWTTSNVVHPDDLPRAFATLAHSMATGTPYEFEMRCRRADGVYRWFQSRGRPVRDAGMCIVRWYFLMTDIEDRKRAEDAIRLSEHRLNQIINTIPATAWSTLPDGYCDFLNYRWLNYAGLTEEQALGWGWSVAIHPDDARRLDVIWKSCLANGTPLDAEARIRRHDGVFRWFLFRANPMRDDSGNIIKWYGTNTDIDDRRRTEEKLRRSEAFLAEGQRASLTGSFSWRVDQDEVIFSEESSRIFGFPPDEPITLLRIGERVHPDDIPMLTEKTGEARISGSDQDYEIRVRMPDGALKFLHTMSHAVRDSEGRLEYIGAIQDVTARHLAEEELRKSELHLRQMTETIPEMLWSATAEGAIDYCNGRLLEYTGFSADEVKGAGWTKLLHPDDVERAVRTWQQSVATGDPYVVEVRALHAARGSYRWCLTNALPLVDQQGRILKWYGTVVDMHDRKRAEEALRRSEARKTAILDSALDCIVTIDHEGRITEFNPAAERTFGYRRGEVLGKLFTELVIPRPLRERYKEFANYLTNGEMQAIGRRVELSAMRADGSEFPIEVAVTRIRSDGLPSFTGYLRDITDRKRAEEELRRSEASLREAHDELAHVTRVTTMGELAASIAHEINQPIAGVVINGNACLRWLSRVEDDSTNLAEARETIQRIIRDGNRAGEIIARIRALFKKTELAREPLDINETIRDVIVLVQSEMKRQHVALRLELPSDLPLVLGDRVQLQQVMLNLMLNAIDAMSSVAGRPRDLIIQTQGRAEGEVLVTVRDSGVGLEPAATEHIFAAFHTTKPGGLGMGLSISRSIVESHSGRLWVTSHDGPGASFHFTLLTAPEAKA